MHTGYERRGACKASAAAGVRVGSRTAAMARSAGKPPLSVSSTLDKAPVRWYFRNANQRLLLLRPSPTADSIATGQLLRRSYESCWSSTSS